MADVLPALAALFGNTTNPTATPALSLGPPGKPAPSMFADPSADPSAGGPTGPLGGGDGTVGGAGGSNVLALLPSAIKARQQQAMQTSKPAAGGGGDGFLGGGLGDVLSAGVDAAQNKSPLGAFAAGFAHGLKASSDYDTNKANSASKASNDATDQLMKLFGVQNSANVQAETSRHNQATEAQAKSDAEAPDTPSALESANSLMRLGQWSGFLPGHPVKPGELGFDDLPVASRNAARAKFIAGYKDGHDGKDPPHDLVGDPYTEDAPAGNTDNTPSFWSNAWSKMTAPGNPAAPANIPTAPAGVSRFGTTAGQPVPLNPDGTAAGVAPAVATTPAPNWTRYRAKDGSIKEFDPATGTSRPAGAAP